MLVRVGTEVQEVLPPPIAVGMIDSAGQNGRMSEDAPVITVVRGTPSAEEVAALVGALLTTATAPEVPAAPRSDWWASGLPARRRDWRASGLPTP